MPPRAAVAVLAVMLAACTSAADPILSAPGEAPVASAVRTLPAPPISLPGLNPPDLTAHGAMEQGGWIRGTVPAGTLRLTAGGAEVPFNPAGRFFIGLDRDAPGSLRLSATGSGGQAISREFVIVPRAWQIERVGVPLRGSVPSEVFMQRRRPELEAIAAARATGSNSEGWRQAFIWPAKGRISGRFGSQRIYQGVPGAYHSGLDIATGGNGAPYVAPADGVVVLAASRPYTLEGNLLIIDHGMGLNSAFLHSSRLAVKLGDRVRQGQVIGYIGATGRATGPHLHWSLKWRDARLDPLLFLPPHETG